MALDRLYQAALQPLKEEADVRLVYAFGSAVHGQSGALSDLDLAVLLARDIASDAEQRVRAVVSDSVPNVDLVILNGAPPVLRWEVVTGGRCLLWRSDAERAEFEIGTLSRFLDMQPFRRLQQQYLRERLRERRGSED